MFEHSDHIQYFPDLDPSRPKPQSTAVGCRPDHTSRRHDDSSFTLPPVSSRPRVLSLSSASDNLIMRGRGRGVHMDEMMRTSS